MRKILLFILLILMLLGCNNMPTKNGITIEEYTETPNLETINEVIIEREENDLFNEPETQTNRNLFKYKSNVLYNTIELTEEQLIIYDKLSKAVEERESSINIDNLSPQEFNEVYFAYIWSNPLSAMINFKLTETENIGEDNSVHLNYKFSMEEHQAIIEEWRAKIETIFENYVDMSSSDGEIAKQLYMFTAGSINYDYSQLEGSQLQDNDLIGTAYYALIYGNGICNDYAQVYNYLLMQAGIDCMHVIGGGHAWSLVKLDDLYYHCDPTWESGYLTGNKDLDAYEPIYFGMSSDMIFNMKYAEEITTTINVYKNINVSVSELVDVARTKNYGD